MFYYFSLLVDTWCDYVFTGRWHNVLKSRKYQGFCRRYCGTQLWLQFALQSTWLVVPGGVQGEFLHIVAKHKLADKPHSPTGRAVSEALKCHVLFFFAMIFWWRHPSAELRERNDATMCY